MPAELVEQAVQRRGAGVALEKCAGERERRMRGQRIARDGLQLELVGGQAQIHQWLRGRPRMRSAMIVRWIWALPP